MNVNKKDVWLFRTIIVTLVLAVVGKVFFLIDPVSAGSKNTSISVNNNSNIQDVTKTENLFVNVYSSRKEHLVSELFDEFTNKTGIKVNFISDKAGKLISRMKAEGKHSPADLFMTSDVGNLEYAYSEGLLKPFNSKVLLKRIPANLRSTNTDKSLNWVGLTLRARVLIYSKENVKLEDLSTYENLAEEKWRGKILVRSSNNIYNQSLLASLIEKNGIDKAEKWAKAIVLNMARKPQGGDTDQIRAVAAGEGDIAIANSYYYGRLMASNRQDDKEIISKTGIFFPNQDVTLEDGSVVKGDGTHVNISGGGVVSNSKHEENAIKLLEFLASDKAQKIYAEKNQEFPVVQNIEKSSVVSSWGEFKMSKLHLATLAEHREDVLKIFDRSGWR